MEVNSLDNIKMMDHPVFSHFDYCRIANKGFVGPKGIPEIEPVVPPMKIYRTEYLHFKVPASTTPEPVPQPTGNNQQELSSPQSSRHNSESPRTSLSRTTPTETDNTIMFSRHMTMNQEGGRSPRRDVSVEMEVDDDIGADDFFHNQSPPRSSSPRPPPPRPPLIVVPQLSIPGAQNFLRKKATTSSAAVALQIPKINITSSRSLFSYLPQKPTDETSRDSISSTTSPPIQATEDIATNCEDGNMLIDEDDEEQLVIKRKRPQTVTLSFFLCG